MIITLTGPNNFLIKQALDSLVAGFTAKFGVHAIERVSGDDIEPARLAELLQGVSLFAAERLVIMQGSANNKMVWEALGDWLERIPVETTLVVAEPLLDKRTRTYKLLTKRGDFRTFDELSEHELAQWLQTMAANSGTQLDTATAAYLVQRVGNDQWRLWQELQKLLNRSGPVTRGSIDELVEPNLQASAFEVLDAALGRKPQATRQLLEALSTLEDPYKFFGLLVSQIQALAVVKSAGSQTSEVIAKDAGLHPFVVRKTQKLARTMSQSELKRLIDTVARCDLQLKTTGGDPWQLLGLALQTIAAQ